MIPYITMGEWTFYFSIFFVTFLFLFIFNKIERKKNLINIWTYNYLIIVSKKNIPLYRDFNIHTKFLKETKQTRSSQIKENNHKTKQRVSKLFFRILIKIWFFKNTHNLSNSHNLHKVIKFQSHLSSTLFLSDFYWLTYSNTWLYFRKTRVLKLASRDPHLLYYSLWIQVLLVTKTL